LRDRADQELAAGHLLARAQGEQIAERLLRGEGHATARRQA
jgi:hypothetical protein